MTAPRDKALAPGGPEISAQQVVDYLRRNPDFLTTYPDVLDHLAPPSRNGGRGVVDMQAYMIERLRGRHDDLLQSGRRHVTRQSQINDAVIALLGAATLEHLIEIVTADFLRALNLDVAALCVESASPPRRHSDSTGVTYLAPGVIDALIGPGRPMVIVGGDDGAADECGGDERIFGAGAGLACSAALIRLNLGDDAPAALLALGSRQADRFPTGQGGEALIFLGRVLERCLNGWLERPQG